MVKNIKYLGVVLLIAMLMFGCTSTSQTSTQPTMSGHHGKGQSTMSGNSSGKTLTASEKQGLIKMREEEKLAHDVYATLYKKWHNPVLGNIMKSEQTHTTAVKQLLEKYHIPDPVVNNATGVFNSSEMRALYVKLVSMGNKSELDALKVGAMVEDLDIKDLDELINQTNNTDIKNVYSNLVRGSRNHLRSFVKAIRAMGGDYEPHYISKQQFDSILNSTMERGNGGQHQGKGMH